MELETRRCSAKLTELKEVSEDAVLLRDKARDELTRHEEVAYAHRKRRELELVNMRRTLDSCKEQLIPTRALTVIQTSTGIRPFIKRLARSTESVLLLFVSQSENGSTPSWRNYALISEMLFLAFLVPPFVQISYLSHTIAPLSFVCPPPLPICRIF